MRQNFTENQEITSEDLNNISSRIETQFYDEILKEIMGNAKEGFFSNGFLVERIDNQNIRVKKGVGLVLDKDHPENEPEYRQIRLTSDKNITLENADPTYNRRDIIVVKSIRITGVERIKKFKSPGSKVIEEKSIPTITDWSSEIIVVKGVLSAGFTEPQTPVGYVKIAEIYIYSRRGLITQHPPTDRRTKLKNLDSYLLDLSNTKTNLETNITNTDTARGADTQRKFTNADTALDTKLTGLMDTKDNAVKVLMNTKDTSLQTQIDNIALKKVLIGQTDTFNGNDLRTTQMSTNHRPILQTCTVEIRPLDFQAAI